MQGLDKQLVDALRAAVEQAVQGPWNGNWQALQGDLKTKAYQATVETLVGKDKQTLSSAILKALNDDTISRDEWRSVAVAWATGQTANPLARDLLGALDDGELTREELVQIAVKWAQGRTSSQPVRDLLAGVSAGGFDQAAAWNALRSYLNERSSLPAEVVAAVIDAVEGPDEISVQDVLAVLAAWAAAAGDADFGEIIKKLGTDDPGKAVIAWINGRLPVDLEAVLRAVGKQDWLGLGALILGWLEPGLAADLVTSLAQGKLREEAVTQLSKYLAAHGAEHAGDIATAIVDLVTGARSLFAEGPEGDAPAVLDTPARVALWRECREVIYLTQLECSGGAIVSGDPQACPHVFRAAAIRFTTPLHGLVPQGSTLEHRERFCGILTAYLDAHFGRRMRAAFHSTGDNALQAYELVAGGPTRQCSRVFHGVNQRLLNPV